MTDDPRALAAAVFDRAASTYDAVGVDFFGPVGERLVRLAAPVAGERVLDVGCGPGASLLPAAEAVGRSGVAVGLDRAPGMVARAEAAARERGLDQVTVLVGDAQEPAVEPGFDLVLGGLVLFFLPDPAAALRAYARLLRPGGRLAVSTFAGDDARWSVIHQVAVRYTGKAPARPPGTADGGPFSSSERLATLVSEAGFVGVRSEEDELDVRFRDGDQWWDWTWSTGARVTWERVPADQLDALRRDLLAAAALVADQEPDGVPHWRPRLRWTTARRPGGVQS